MRPSDAGVYIYHLQDVDTPLRRRVRTYPKRGWDPRAGAQEPLPLERHFVPAMLGQENKGTVKTVPYKDEGHGERQA